jgi:molybdopterin molybdotransferase
VIHRIGVVPVGEAAIYVGIAGRHRAEAFALLGEFMDRLKKDVPIWKLRAIAQPNETGIMNSSASADGGGETTRPPGVFSATQVLALISQLCVPLAAERVALADALVRVLRKSVCAPEDQPPFDRSSVDGYAVGLNDPATHFRIVDEIRAGDWKPRILAPGEAMRIATGGALPGTGLRVVMKEDVQIENGTLTLLRREEEQNIRFRGEDARAGQELAGAGTVLMPGTIGLLASVGCIHPAVTRLPRVLHLATGNEIVPPDQAPGHGQIRDSNSSLVRSFLGQWRIAPEQRRVGEDASALEAAITNAPWPLAETDLLLISGGASVGKHDFTRELLQRASFNILVSKTTARPGKPLIVAQRGSTLAFGLPGNPLAHFVCLNLYVRAALEAWSGRTSQIVFQPGVLDAELSAGGSGRETFWPAHWRLQNGASTLTPLRWSSSGDLTAMATANALIRVRAGTRRLPPGGNVEFARTERT